MARRMVVLDSPHERAYPLSHEHGTRIELARRLASFKGFDFAGEYDPSRRYKGPLYFVPSDTLTSERANQLRPSSRSAPSGDYRGYRESTAVPHRDGASVQRVCLLFDGAPPNGCRRLRSQESARSGLPESFLAGSRKKPFERS